MVKPPETGSKSRAPSQQAAERALHNAVSAAVVVGGRCHHTKGINARRSFG